MINQFTTQEDECFVTTQAQQQQHTTTQQYNDQQTINLNIDIRNSLPQANQLIHYTRPTQMFARILTIQANIQCLPNILDQSCQEIIVQTTTTNNNIKAKLNNKDKLSLADYLLRKQIYVIYTKQSFLLSSLSSNLQINSKKSINQITFRLRMISQSSDYNSKQFKQLIKYQPNFITSSNQNQNNQETNTNKQLQQQDLFYKINNRMQDKIDSYFQCGNLAKVYGHVDNYHAYYLLLEQDTNTHGYTNWFFYRVKNIGIGIRKFYILNLVKQTGFYKQGMKISIFSMQKNKQQGMKWFKGGNNISFFQTSFLREQHNDYFNCLYFQYNFQHQNDQVYFAASQPYTYTRVANLFKSLKQKTDNTFINWKIQTVGYSISNNIIPSITFFLKNQQSQNKKTIVIIGRQHPSQVAGSFISQYLIKMFQEQKEQIKLLLKKFNILIIPMVNPDGVIYGNSRSNLSGFDLNRHWGVDAIKQLTPQTNKIRTLLSQLQKNNNNIKFLLDLHGHGKKLNSFLFCCKKQDRISNRIFPLIMSKIQKRFDLVSCTYGITRDKQNTIRAQLYDIGINDCYTLENSYYGYYKNKQDGQIISYNQKDYQNIACSIIQSLYIFLSSNQKNQKDKIKQKYGFNLQTINQELMKIVDRLQRQQKNIVYDQDIMSESDPEGDGLKLQERLKICTNNKVLDKKIRQSFKKNKIFLNDKIKNVRKGKIQKNQKIKTQPYQQKDDGEQEDLKILEQKIQSKLILSKKLKTQNKMRASTRQRKSMLQTKRPLDENQQKIVKKFLNKSFNPFQIPKQPPAQFSKSQFVHTSKNISNGHAKPFERCKIYEKLKTQISQNHSFTVLDIQLQNQRKQKIQGQLTKLKQQNLKNVVKQSLLFMGSSLKGKKCKWVEEKKSRNLASNHIIEAKFYTENTQDYLKNNIKQQKSQASLNKSKKIIIRANTQQSIVLKTQSEPKKTRPKRSYHRFQSFVQNIPIPSIRKILNDNKGPVFYHFPVM